ncbi:MAG: carboxylesterase family protein [Frankiales bacterium]|nr:carboxylesterase family protein [Frankiales bacterium]MCW2708172.1 carboxylesterase family protein [Frankiales bacterium]
MLLVLACLGLVAVANGLRPFRWTPLVVPSFFAAWLTVELAPQLLALTVVVTLLLTVVVGVSWLGLLVTVLVVAGLLVMIAESERAAAKADTALAEWPEPPEREPFEAGLVRRFFRPMSFRHPDVERTVDVAYGDLPRHKLDVYRRKDHPVGAPTLVQVHGGAWVIGDKREQGRPLMNHLAARGWVCFAPNYRLSPRATWPDHLVDVKRALAWVREHGEDYGADPGFLVLTGGSAGGHLTALCALTQNDPMWQPGFEDADTSVTACVPYYGVYDLNGETGTTAATVREKRLLARMVMKTRDREVFRLASPLSHIDGDAPPFFVVHGRNDTLVPVEEARLFVERLRAASSNPVLYLELPGTEHAFDVFPSIRSDHVVRAVGRFCELVRVRLGHGVS